MQQSVLKHQTVTHMWSRFSHIPHQLFFFFPQKQPLFEPKSLGILGNCPKGKTGIQELNKLIGAPSDQQVDSRGQPPPVVTDSQSHTCPTALKP